MEVIEFTRNTLIIPTELYSSGTKEQILDNIIDKQIQGSYTIPDDYEDIPDYVLNESHVCVIVMLEGSIDMYDAPTEFKEIIDHFQIEGKPIFCLYKRKSDESLQFYHASIGGSLRLSSNCSVNLMSKNYFRRYQSIEQFRKIREKVKAQRYAEAYGAHGQALKNPCGEFAFTSPVDSIGKNSKSNCFIFTPEEELTEEELLLLLRRT